MRYFFLSALVLLIACNSVEEPLRSFSTSFESEADFEGFYITPQGHLETTFHALDDSLVHSGTFSHKAWITGANPPSTTFQNNNHRGYPTIQLENLPEGSFRSPVYVTLWVWLDMELTAREGEEDDWFSFATFTGDESDGWDRTVLVNLNADGFVHLMHVPRQGAQEHLFQTTDLPFPQREWVELKIFLDFSNDGYAKVWQNGTLVSHAQVKGTRNRIAQAHFGLYCPPQLTEGVVYNDDLTIEMVTGE